MFGNVANLSNLMVLVIKWTAIDPYRAIQGLKIRRTLKETCNQFQNEATSLSKIEHYTNLKNAFSVLKS